MHADGVLASDRPMRLLMVCDYLGSSNPSGAGRYALEMGRALQKLGHPTRFLAGGTPEDPETDGQDGFPAISRFPFPLGGGRLRWLLTGGTSRIRTAYERLAADFRPTHLLIHQPLVGRAVLPASKGLPAFYLFHSSWGSELEAEGAWPWERWPRDWIERGVIGRCVRAAALTRYMEGEMRRIHAGLDIPLKLAPGGADLERFRYVQDPGTDGSPLVLTVRRLVPRMGLETLLEAWKAVSARHPRARLVIAGRGPLEGVLRSSLPPGASLAGYVPEADLPRLLGSADLFVLPSQRLEGFGMVIPEAMASGTPVLGTPIGGIPEVLGAFDPALVTSDLAGGISRLLDDPVRLRAMRPACRAYAEKHFNWDRTAASLAGWMERGA